MVGINVPKLEESKLLPGDEHLDVHPFVQLLVKRMESHPTEFYRYDTTRNPLSTTITNNRMTTTLHPLIEQTKALWNRRERRLYAEALRAVRLEEAHQRMMAAMLSPKP